MKELEGQHCRVDFLDYDCYGAMSRFVVIEKVDMPMVKMRDDYEGASSRWVNASIIAEIVTLNRV